MSGPDPPPRQSRTVLSAQGLYNTVLLQLVEVYKWAGQHIVSASLATPPI